MKAFFEYYHCFYFIFTYQTDQKQRCCGPFHIVRHKCNFYRYKNYFHFGCSTDASPFCFHLFIKIKTILYWVLTYNLLRDAGWKVMVVCNYMLYSAYRCGQPTLNNDNRLNATYFSIFICNGFSIHNLYAVITMPGCIPLKGHERGVSANNGSGNH